MENKNKDVMVKRIEQLNATKMVKVFPELEISKKQMLVINVLSQNNNVLDYSTLAQKLDIKPSKLDDILAKLALKKIVVVKEGKVELLENKSSFCKKSKKQEKRIKKFEGFIEALTDEEFKEFLSLISSFKSEIDKPKNINEVKETA